MFMILFGLYLRILSLSIPFQIVLIQKNTENYTLLKISKHRG